MPQMRPLSCALLSAKPRTLGPHASGAITCLAEHAKTTHSEPAAWPRGMHHGAHRWRTQSHTRAQFMKRHGTSPVTSNTCFTTNTAHTHTRKQHAAARQPRASAHSEPANAGAAAGLRLPAATVDGRDDQVRRVGRRALGGVAAAGAQQRRH